MNKTIAAIGSLTICAMTLGFGASRASADDVTNTRSFKKATLTYTVRFADLDVSNVEGAKSLYVRLQHAAKVVCKPLEIAPLFHSNQYDVCLKKAIADAVATVNRPFLTQYHHVRTKGDKSASLELARAN